MFANTKHMSLYDEMARNQARGSYRASLMAMAAGLLIVFTGLGAAVFANESKLNNYLLLLTADDSDVDVGDDELLKVLPAEVQVSALGDFADRAQQPAPFGFGSDTQPRGGFN
jgi:hypothetical protein